MAGVIIGKEKTSQLEHKIRDNKTLYYAASAFYILMLAMAIAMDAWYLIALPFTALLFYTGWLSLPSLFFLLIASIPFSTEYQFSGTLGTDLPDEMLMLLVSAVFLFYLIQRGRAFFQLIRHPLTIILLTMMSWSVVASLFSTQPLLSLKYLLAKTWYIAAFAGAAVMVVSEKRNLKGSALILAFSMLVVTVMIFVRHLFAGLSFATINEAVLPFFRNHVNYSALLVCTIPLWWACRALSSSARSRNLIAAVLVFLLTALLLSYARGAWLALLAGITAAWLIKRRSLLRGIAIVSVILVLAFAWLIRDNRYLDFAPDYNETVFHEDFREHLVATYEMNDLSAAERFYRWIAGVRMIPDHWLSGVGPGTFYHNYKPYAVPVFETWVSDNPERSTVHNYFLLTMVEQGLPGLILLLLFCAAVLYYTQHLFHRSKDIFYKMASLITGVIFSMILSLNFLSDLVETDKIGSLFFLCMGALLVIDKMTRPAVAA